jgi:hypothetical protein
MMETPMILRALALGLCLLFADVALTQDSPTAALADMTSYRLGIFRKGPRWSSESPEKIKAATEAHKGAIGKLVQSGKLAGAVRVLDSERFWSVVIFKSADPKELPQLVSSFKLVEEGILDFTTMDMWGPRLPAKRPRAAAAGDATMYLVSFTKGKTWTGEVTEKVRNLLADEARFLMSKASEGVIRFQAYAANDLDELRGLVLLNVASEGEARMLMASSPMVKQQWLYFQVYKVSVPPGGLP